MEIIHGRIGHKGIDRMGIPMENPKKIKSSAAFKPLEDLDDYTGLCAVAAQWCSQTDPGTWALEQTHSPQERCPNDVRAFLSRSLGWDCA